MSQSPGNLLSNIKPPSELPSFVTAVAELNVKKEEEEEPNVEEQFIPTTFSPAIPMQINTDSSPTISTPINQSPPYNDKFAPHPGLISTALEPITQGGSNILGWMKDAVGNSGEMFLKVAEKAKNSVDSIVTTLDPQMREYLNSGGDVEIIVASDKDDKVRPIREAFQLTFGKATVTGLPAQPQTVAAQPINYNNALLGAQERIDHIRKTAGPGGHLPIVAIENFAVEIFPEEWFEGGLIILSDSTKNIQLKSITQLTPIPSSVITTIQAEMTEDYQFKSTGFPVTVGHVMAINLKTNHTEWHKTYTSVNRSDMILNAAKTLACLYKQSILEK